MGAGSEENIPSADKLRSKLSHSDQFKNQVALIASWVWGPAYWVPMACEVEPGKVIQPVNGVGPPSKFRVVAGVGGEV